jgi:aspartate-semialdehyde dehydrogenase
VRTIEQIEESSDIDAVVICTPTDTHADLIERFARAGKASSAKSRSISTRPRRRCHQGGRQDRGR